MNKQIEMLLPEDINISDYFVQSSFRNNETEIVARNIVIIERAINPKAWVPFSVEDYEIGCRRVVCEEEKVILEILVDGGKPAWNTTAFIEPGYLFKDNEGKFRVTNKFLRVISKFAKA